MSVSTISAGQRHQMISEAAYFRAEGRGFRGDDSLTDWVEAEAEINARLGTLQHAALLKRLEDQLSTAGEKLRDLRKKVAGKRAAARAEWQEDLERFAKLRDAFEKKLQEIRERGEDASENVKEQAEDISGEIAEVIRRTRRRIAARQ